MLILTFDPNQVPAKIHEERQHFQISLMTQLQHYFEDYQHSNVVNKMS